MGDAGVAPTGLGNRGVALDRSPRRSRPRAPAVPTLDLDTRLALEDRILPLLDALRLEQLWTRLLYPLAELPQRDLGVGWSELVSRCSHSGQLPQLARLLERLLPELKGEPLLDALRAS